MTGAFGEQYSPLRLLRGALDPLKACRLRRHLLACLCFLGRGLALGGSGLLLTSFFFADLGAAGSAASPSPIFCASLPSADPTATATFFTPSSSSASFFLVSCLLASPFLSRLSHLAPGRRASPHFHSWQSWIHEVVSSASPRPGLRTIEDCGADKVKRKMVPWPGPFDSTQMRPAWRATIVRHKVNPKPVPGISEPCSRVNGSKIRSS